MARIRSFAKGEDRSRVHTTEVDCNWAVVESGGTRLVQLDTFGSDGREIPGKVSQTLQLDRQQAANLIAILRRVFPTPGVTTS